MVDKTTRSLESMEIADFININKIIKHLLKKNNIEECVKLLL